MCGRRWDPDVPLTDERTQHLSALLTKQVTERLERIKDALTGRQSLNKLVETLELDWQEYRKKFPITDRSPTPSLMLLLEHETWDLVSAASSIARTRLECKWLQEQPLHKEVLSIRELIADFGREQHLARLKNETEVFASFAQCNYKPTTIRFRQWL